MKTEPEIRRRLAEMEANIRSFQVSIEREENGKLEMLRWVLGELGDSPASTPPPSTKRRALPPWNPPDFWIPLTTLDDYIPKRYRSSAGKLEKICANHGVAPVVVVRAFVDYWPTGKGLFGWVDPVKAFMRTLDVQISKVKRGSNGRVPESGRQPPRESVSESWGIDHGRRSSSGS